MKIKDYKCKCEQDDFFFADKGNQTGIYCSYCGKWLKWADKDEQNLRMKQVSVLDKIRAEIVEERDFAYADFEQYKVDCLGVDAEYVEDELPQDDFRYGMERCIDIIDKYKAESEDKG